MFTTITTSDGYILQISKSDKCRIEIFYLDKDRKDVKHSFGIIELSEDECLNLIDAVEFHTPRVLDEDFED